MGVRCCASVTQTSWNNDYLLQMDYLRSDFIQICFLFFIEDWLFIAILSTLSFLCLFYSIKSNSSSSVFRPNEKCLFIEGILILKSKKHTLKTRLFNERGGRTDEIINVSYFLPLSLNKRVFKVSHFSVRQHSAAHTDDFVRWTIHCFPLAV